MRLPFRNWIKRILSTATRQKTNLKQGHLLRTLPLSPFWIHYQSRGRRQTQCWQTGDT
jgi:hypothetical protein